jgi:Circadian oscillating protein COP23
MKYRCLVLLIGCFSFVVLGSATAEAAEPEPSAEITAVEPFDGDDSAATLTSAIELVNEPEVIEPEIVESEIVEPVSPDVAEALPPAGSSSTIQSYTLPEGGSSGTSSTAADIQEATKQAHSENANRPRATTEQLLSDSRSSDSQQTREKRDAETRAAYAAKPKEEPPPSQAPASTGNNSGFELPPIVVRDASESSEGNGILPPLSGVEIPAVVAVATAVDTPESSAASSSNTKNLKAASSKKLELESVAFQCGTSDSTPATIAKIKDLDELLVIRWASDFFKAGGYDAQTRCEQVSARFESYKTGGDVLYLTSGKLNGQSVICVTSQEDGSCGTGIESNGGLLFTLKPTDDSQATLEDLVTVLQSKPESDLQPIEQ